MEQIDKLVEKQLQDVMRKYEKGGAVIFEIFSENYFNATSAVLKCMAESLGGGRVYFFAKALQKCFLALKAKRDKA